MKKLTPKHVFFILIIAAIIIPLLIYGWNEIRKQPIDLVMYGAEIKADGTVVQETEFHLAGYMRAYYGPSKDFVPYQIFLEPVLFPGTSELKQDLHQAETFLMMAGNIHAPYYTARFHTLTPQRGSESSS